MNGLSLVRHQIPRSLRFGFPLASAVFAAFAMAAFFVTVATGSPLAPLARLLAVFPVALSSYRRRDWAPGLAYIVAFSSTFIWQAAWSAAAGNPEADVPGAFAAVFLLLAVSSVMRSIAAGRDQREALANAARARGELLDRATSLDQVAAFVCEEATATLEAEGAGLLIRNPVDDQWEIYSAEGMHIAPADHSETILLAEWLAVRNENLVVDDLLVDGRFDSAGPSRSLIARSLRNPGGALIAILALTHSRPGRFVQSDFAALNALCGAAEAALGHASSYARAGWATERLATQLAAIQRTARELNMDMSAESIVQRTLACAMELAGAKTGAIYVEVAGAAPLVLTDGSVNSEETRSALAQAALATHPQLQPSPQRAVLLPEARSRLIVPIRRESRKFGALMLENDRDGTFNIQDMQAVAALASHAAVALENTRLFKEVQGLARFQRDLLATFSHELRAPLANISALAEVALSGDMNKPSPEILELLKAQSRRLAALSQRTLEAERLEAGAWPLQLRPLAVGALIREAAHRWQGAVPDRVIDVRGAELAGWAWGDEDAAGLILDNLLENAVKHSEPGSPITVYFERGEPNVVTVGVENTGVPIPEHQRGLLFERFYRLELQDNRKTYGFGLGLYIVRQLSAAMGGRAWIEPAGDWGNRFAFCLPLMEVADENPGGGG